MKKIWSFATVLAVLATPALGQQLFFYPAQGQPADQQNFDRFECHTWAVQQTGFDPSTAQVVTAPPPPPTQAVTASPLRGAAGGALGGLAIGAIAGDAGKGAAIGAVSGGVFGGIRRRNQVSQQQQQRAAVQSQQQAAANNQGSAYNRALSACMQGRGYSVS